MYREGYPPSNEGDAQPPQTKTLVQLVGSMTSARKDKDTSSAKAPSSFEPPLEALLGLDLSSSTTEKEQKKEAAAKSAVASTSTSSSSALPSDLDDLLNMGLSACKSGGAGGGGSGSGKKTTMPSDIDDDLELDDLLGQPKPSTSSVPAAPSSKAKAKKLSALDAGDY